MNLTKCQTKSIFPKTKRILVIGDLHGDWEITKKIFVYFKIIDINGRWIAEPKDTKIVQVGDIVDRGGRPHTIGDECSELKIMDFIDDIHQQAEVYGGGIFCILGNHELMNVVGNFDYSGKESISCFGGVDQRKEVFKPGGYISRYFSCHRKVVIKIGKFLFVHGGFGEKHLDRSIEKINKTMEDYLKGNKKLYNDEFINYYMAFEGVLWNRELSFGNPDCNKVNKILKHFDAGGIIVGHTVQENGINSKCDNKVWRVDIGMSKAFGESDKLEILEIWDDGEKLEQNNYKPFRILS